MDMADVILTLRISVSANDREQRGTKRTNQRATGPQFVLLTEHSGESQETKTWAAVPPHISTPPALLDNYTSHLWVRTLTTARPAVKLRVCFCSVGFKQSVMSSSVWLRFVSVALNLCLCSLVSKKTCCLCLLSTTKLSNLMNQPFINVFVVFVRLLHLAVILQNDLWPLIWNCFHKSEFLSVNLKFCPLILICVHNYKFVSVTLDLNIIIWIYT